MKTLFLIMFIAINIFADNNITTSETQNLNTGTTKLLLKSIEFNNSKVLLDSITDNAIKIGDGERDSVYVFVDPMCPHSKRFIKKIISNKMAQVTTSYYIFLYRLPKFESTKLIQYIYQSKDSYKSLENVMIKGASVDLDNFSCDENVLANVHKVDYVAEKLKVKKRPFMIVFSEGSGYCSVSEGSAPCLEELDFD